MKMFYFLLCVFASIALNSGNNSEPRTRISDGEVIGTNYTTYSGRSIYSFYGIPFAAPPVGDLRFEPPQPPKPWKKPWRATSKADYCVQLFLAAPVTSVGSEDCLYLDVYTPAVPKDGKCEKLYHVFFYLFPSAFLITGGGSIEPYYLMDKYDIVFVTPNYRLGLFGFLNTGDEVVPGNMGFKDQVMALKWVQKNIRSFCGNPNSVTLSGASAGGVSSSLQLVSPLSKGLFHRAIINSGSAFIYSLFNSKTSEYTRTVGRQMNCPTNSSRVMIQCMKKKPSYIFSDFQLQFRSFFFTPIIDFGAVVEPCNEGAFLTKTPAQALVDGDLHDVPILFIQGEYEGAVLIYFMTVPGISEVLDLTYVNNLPKLIGYQTLTPRELLNEVSIKIKKEYYGNRPFTGDEDTFKKFNTDWIFLVSLYNTSLFYANHQRSPVYNLFCTYRAQFSSSVLTSIIQTTKNYGNSHVDTDLLAVFNGLVDKKVRRNENDLKMIALLTEMYTSFMRDGKPSLTRKVKWQPQPKRSKKFRYLRLDNASLMHQVEDENFGKNKFWSSLPINLYRGFPIDSCRPHQKLHNFEHP